MTQSRALSRPIFPGGKFAPDREFFLYTFASVCAIMYTASYVWRLNPMASTKNPSARELRKKKTMRIVAFVACAALLITAVMPYIASALY